MRFATILVPLLLLAGVAHSQQGTPQGYVPPHGFVPDSATAVRIAIAVWIPIYGERQIMSERPFVATLKDSVWTVTGTLPRGAVGGTAVAMIAKSDGRVLFVIHYE